MYRRLLQVARVIKVPYSNRQISQNPVSDLKNGLLLSDSCVKRLQSINDGESDLNQYHYMNNSIICKKISQSPGFSMKRGKLYLNIYVTLY